MAFTDTALITSQVSLITGSLEEGLKAGAYSAWVQSISGQYPVSEQLPGNRARITWRDDAQIKSMQDWLDRQVVSAFTPPDKKPVVEYDFGPVLKPWAVKYAAPAGIGVFALGFAAAFVVLKLLK